MRRDELRQSRRSEHCIRAGSGRTPPSTASRNRRVHVQYPVKDGLDFIGLIAAPRLIQPILVLFTAHQFGPLFFFVIPAGLWLWKNRGRQEPRVEIALLWGLLGLVWFMTLSYVSVVLYVDPRYYMVTVYSGVLVVALWLRTLSLKRNSFSLIALLSVGNLLMIYLDNKGLMFGEKTLVAIARSSDEPIYTDPATLNGAKFLLKHTATGHNIIADLAPAGGLFFIILRRRVSNFTATA